MILYIILNIQWLQILGDNIYFDSRMAISGDFYIAFSVGLISYNQYFNWYKMFK